MRDELNHTVAIRRETDNKMFDIPIMQLVLEDRLKIIQLSHGNREPYWFTEYGTLPLEQLEEAPTVVLFVRNGAYEDSFMHFIYDTLLSDEFVTKATRGVTICVLETVPETLDKIEDSRYRPPRTDKLSNKYRDRAIMIKIDGGRHSSGSLGRVKWHTLEDTTRTARNRYQDLNLPKEDAVNHTYVTPHQVIKWIR